jgi:hypothetical protein
MSSLTYKVFNLHISKQYMTLTDLTLATSVAAVWTPLKIPLLIVIGSALLQIQFALKFI